MMTSSKLNQEATFWFCIASLILLYISLTFTVPQCIRFVRCILMRNKLDDSLHPFAQIRQPIICTIHLSLFCTALYIIYPVVLILEMLDAPNTFCIHVIATWNLIIFLSFVSRALVLVLNQLIVDTLNNWIWRKEINAKERETNIIIKYDRVLNVHRSTVILLSYLLFIILISALFIVMVHFYYDHFPVIYTITVAIFLLLSYYIVTMKMCMVADQYEVRNELLYTVQSSGAFYGLSSVLSLFVPHIYSILIQILCVSIGHLFAIYFCCGWAVKQFTLHNLKHVAQDVKHSDFMRAFTKKNPIIFKQIMDHRIGIEAFCAHLAEEYSLDSILFIIEVSQFKAVVNNLRTVKLSDNDTSESTTEIIETNIENIETTGALPTDESAIFSVNTILRHDWLPIDPRMHSHSPYKLALYLYDKYIDNGADLCINISSTDRRNIYKTFKELACIQGMEPMNKQSMELDDSTIDILYTVFNKPLIEIWHLLENDSFYRFRSTHAMYRLLCALYPKQSQNAITKCRTKQKRKRRKKASVKHTNSEIMPIPSTTVTTVHDLDTSTVRSVISAHSVRSAVSRDSTLRSLPDDVISIEFKEVMREEQKYAIPPFKPHQRAQSAELEIAIDEMPKLMMDFGSKSLSNRGKKMEELAQLLNAVTVPSDIIKTAGDFWSDHIHKLNKKDRLEVGCAIYLSMLAADRSIQHLFKRNHKIKQEQIEKLSMKFLDMICWLIESMWSRDLNTLNKQLSKLGAVHKQLSLEIVHFNVMIEAMHEVFQFYFAGYYRLQEQYAMDYIFAYSTEIMMGSAFRPNRKSKSYFKELELKHAAEQITNKLHDH